MAVKLVPIVCPKCGGQIQVPPDRPTCFCTYCGTQIMLDDGSQTINIHNYDEADLKRVELEAEELKYYSVEQAAYEQRHRTWRFAVVGWVVLMIVLLVLVGLTDSDSSMFTAVAMAVTGVLLLGPVALIVLRPRKPKRKR